MIAKTDYKLIQWAETAKHGFKCLKIHSNAYSPKRAKKCQKMVTNVKKCKKITNDCKILEITKLVKNEKNWQKCQQMLKMPKTGSKLPNKNGTSRFHTMFGSRDKHFRSFLAKICIFGSKFQLNQIYYS